MFRVAQGIQLSIPDAICAQLLPKDAMVSITGNRTVDAAGAGGKVFGRVLVPAKAVGEVATIETFFRERHDLKTTGTIAAGDYFKMAAYDQAAGESTVAKWTPGTDAEELKAGVCFKGGAANSTVEVFFR